jgi:signal transduction histidine kinase
MTGVTWWRRSSLRTRLMLIGVCGLAAGLALGAVVLMGALWWGLQRSVDAEVLGTARTVAQMVDEGTLPELVPVAGAQEVQVIDAQGRIRAASIEADRLVPMLHGQELAAARNGARLYIAGDRIGEHGQVRVVAVVAGPSDARLTVLVAKPVADLTQSVHVLRITVTVVFPLLVIGLALLAWRVVGAALRPVEALRRGAEEITGSARAGQLPVPASHDEIHRLAVTLNDMLDRLEAARSRQRAFVADAAHELRSPLANMRTQLEVAQRLADQTDWPAVADDLLADNERLARLVDDLLLLARLDEASGSAGWPDSSSAVEPGPSQRLSIDAGPTPAALSGGSDPGSAGSRPPGGRRAEPVEIGDLLSQVAQRYPSPPVTVTPPGEPLWTAGEPDALRRVIANLVDNAVRHARSRVVLAADSDGAYHRITVTDDGPGIPAMDRERVFGRFTRLDDARARDGGGSGLGLAIVRQLVRQHGGSVQLVDAPITTTALARARLAAARLGNAAAGGIGEAGASTNGGPGSAQGLRAEVRLPALPPAPD